MPLRLNYFFFIIYSLFEKEKLYGIARVMRSDRSTHACGFENKMQTDALMSIEEMYKAAKQNEISISPSMYPLK